MKPKIIKTEVEHQAALAYIETLMDAVPGSPEEDELELFAVLVEDYEKEHFPIELPDPIAAIQFRMEQQNLKRKDLIPFIGSQSKVSEVMNGKIPLSLSMIRCLHEGLGIPAEVLLKEPGKKLEATQYRWQDYPFTEMFNSGYFKSFNGSLQDAKRYSEELLTTLFVNFQGRRPDPVYCRRSEGQMDEMALFAWQARVLELAAEQALPTYEKSLFTEELIREIVKLSKFESGPTLAQELLNRVGIAMIILNHLPHTYLDGACFKSPSGRPIIGLTLRHDRLDNFWFTIIHELAHVYLHLDQNNFAFFDETEGGSQKSCNPQEIEADEMAVRLLVPEDIWKREGCNIISKREIVDFANRLGISPAIIAGRLRWQSQNFNNFSELLGNHAVRKLFITES